MAREMNAGLLVAIGLALGAAGGSLAAGPPPQGIVTRRVMDPRLALPEGRVLEYRVQNRVYDTGRRVWVYTPPGYSSRAGAYPIVVAFDGGEYLDEIPLPLILDSLIAAGRIPPVVAVLVDDSTGAPRIADLGNREQFARFLADDLVPWIRASWNVTRDPHRTVLSGSSAGGLAAAHAAFRRPDLFGNVLSQSGAFWRGNEGSNEAPFEWLTGQYAKAPRKDVRLLLEVGLLETRGALGGSAPSILQANRHLRDVLLKKGYPLIYAEVPGGQHSPESWSQRLPGALTALMSAWNAH